MATINPLFGRMKGKYGGSVMYSNNGKQCMRERVLEVRNPRSSKQAIQRCIMATVNQFVTAFTPVLNNAIESETTKARNLAKIRSYNLNILRQLAANGNGAYCPKGAQFVAGNDYMISRGTLRGMIPLRDATARIFLGNHGGLLLSTNDLIVDDAATASGVFPSVAVGDQITVLVSMTEDYSEGSLNAYCRFAFKDDLTTALISDGEGGYKINPAAIDLTKAAGPWDSLVISELVADIPEGYSALMLGGLVQDTPTGIQCAGIIVSREAERKRSTSYMVSSPSYTPLDEVYPTYMGDGTPIDMPSDVYLNNDANVTPTPFAWITNVNGTPVVLPKSLNVSSTASTLCVLHGKSLPAAFSMQVKFSIEGSGADLTATFTNTTSGTTGGITFELDGSNNIAVTASVASTISAKSIRYYDGDGNDITWN